MRFLSLPLLAAGREGGVFSVGRKKSFTVWASCIRAWALVVFIRTRSGFSFSSNLLLYVYTLVEF